MARTSGLILALAAFVTGVWLAANYPLAQPFPILGFLLFTVLAYLRPWLWPVLLPAIVPVIGLAPWSGWLTFEELDFLVLAMAAGGYANQCSHPGADTAQPLSKTLVILIGLMTVSLLASMFRGFSDAGGFVFGWYQGYNGPMNSLRIAKSFFLALLMLPLLRKLQDQDAVRLGRYLAYGLSLGVGLVSLATIWERSAFTDLLNFSSDYRTTALFWEMHVGGAALDGWLVLTAPFAIWLLKRAKSPAQALPAFLLIGMAAYAYLTTFSRGVYLALLVALPLLGWLLVTRTKSMAREPDVVAWGPVQWCLALALQGGLALLVFPGSGYRGLLALLGLVFLSLSMPAVIGTMPRSRAISSLLLGAFLGGALAWAADLLPKGAYLLYFLFFSFTLAALYFPGFQKYKGRFSPGLIGISGLASAAVNCSIHWGGVAAVPGIVGALLVIAAIVTWGAISKSSLWPHDLRWKGTMFVVGIAASGVVAVFSGGAYMGERFSTSGKDAEGRLAHWQNALNMLQSPLDMVFGKGLGRFPANYFFAIPNSTFPGTYVIGEDDGNKYLALKGGRHPISFGDLLRVSQRLSLASLGPYQLEFKVRANTDVVIHSEVCEKHLLYVAQCVGKDAGVKVKKDEWQNVSIRMDGVLLHNNSWYAPRFKMFSIGVSNQGGAADLDDLSLTELGSSNLLENSGFSSEMQRWFFSSDRNHMPWHAKSLLINILFDQGGFGLIASLLLVGTALWRINIGRGARNELAPYLTAGIVGFLVVGLFDSLTDVPRLAFIYYLVLLYSMELAASGRRKTGK